VTGGSKGSAPPPRGLARAGCNIAVTYRQDRAAADRVVAEITARVARPSRSRPTSVTQVPPPRVFAAARKRLNSDVLVNQCAETA